MAYVSGAVLYGHSQPVTGLACSPPGIWGWPVRCTSRYLIPKLPNHKARQSTLHGTSAAALLLCSGRHVTSRKDMRLAVGSTHMVGITLGSRVRYLPQAWNALPGRRIQLPDCKMSALTRVAAVRSEGPFDTGHRKYDLPKNITYCQNCTVNAMLN